MRILILGLFLVVVGCVSGAPCKLDSRVRAIPELQKAGYALLIESQNRADSTENMFAHGCGETLQALLMYEIEGQGVDELRKACADRRLAYQQMKNAARTVQFSITDLSGQMPDVVRGWVRAGSNYREMCYRVAKLLDEAQSVLVQVEALKDAK
jgi:hypothetical protein